MKTTYKFNMVEIALAIAIIAIGLSAVLVLFPVGINATRAAMDENSSADVSEYVANFVRGKCLSHWKNEYDLWYPNRSNPSNKLDFTLPSGFFKNEKPGAPAANATLDKVVGYTIETTTPNSGLQKLGDGIYRFSRVTAEGEETFAALVKIWSDPAHIKTAGTETTANCPVYVPNAGSNFAQTALGALSLVLPDGNSVDVGHFAQSVMVEISWPVNAADDDRTSRTFRVDVYNPYYTIRPDVTP